MPRITGRTIRPSTLAERRLLLSLGTPVLRVPRQHNPYLVARRVARAARGETPDLLFLSDVASYKLAHPMRTVPKPDTTAPIRKGPVHVTPAA
jgi:hypothetical protein